MNFKSRSSKKELLDQDNILFEDIEQNMKELDIINKYLGGHAITISGFHQLAKGKNHISVCEIGCGGGDNLAAIYKFASAKSIQVSLTGIDIKEACIAFAKQRQHLPAGTHFITSNYASVQFKTKPDIIFSSLFCHHFNDTELADQLVWMKENSTIGFFINDLQRHPFAYYSIKILTALFSTSYLVKNDAPLSVLRGFTKKEWEEITSRAQITVFINWRWAFRFLLTYKHG